MKNLHTMRLAMAAAILALPAMATNNNHTGTTEASSRSSHLETIVAEAKKAQLEAREISSLLKNKNADMNRVNAKMELLSMHASQLSAHIAEFEPQAAGLNAGQKAEFDRMKQTAAILSIFVENKKSLLTGGEAAKNRGLLRAKADGIAKRAELVQASALRIRS